MTETDIGSGHHPEKLTHTPDDDAKQSSRTPKHIPLCASETSSEKPYEVAKKSEKRQCEPTSHSEANSSKRLAIGECEVHAKLSKEDEESDDRSNYVLERRSRGGTLQPPTHLSTHVKLRGAINGERFALPGVGDASTDFAVPTKAFQIQKIVGRHLVTLEKTPSGSLAVQRKKNSEGDTNNKKAPVVLSPAPVCHLLDSLGNVRTHGNLDALADEENFVQVFFHHTRSVEECVDIPCANVEDISTPETPSPPPPSQ